MTYGEGSGYNVFVNSFAQKDTLLADHTDKFL